MKHLIIGTAGHIDHGKTALISALTGRNTDRLKEEQKRGISIDLGFTFFTLPSGLQAGIIDVPGHERFIKNMLAGIMGIDLVVLVIAADEGIMPQTLEHLSILELIGMKRGLIALTKIDLVDEEWAELVEEEVRETTKGTFLEKAKIIRVSSSKKIGLDNLSNEMDDIAKTIENTEDNKLPRLPIDRVFVLKGLGTVVTGTLLSGTFNEGEEVEIYPERIKAKIRTIQVHDEEQKTAYSRQRVALNIPGIKKTEVSRGDVIARPNSLIPTMMIDAKLKLLNIQSIRNRIRIRLYIGSKELLARVILLDREELKGGEEAIVQFRLEEEITAQRGDSFIIRFYSPMFTIGGGEIIDPNPKKHKRYNDEDIKSLEFKEKAGELLNVFSIIEKSKGGLRLSDLVKLSGIEQAVLIEMLGKLTDEKKIRVYKAANDLLLISEDYYKKIGDNIKSILGSYHEKNMYSEGIFKEELLMRVFKEKNSWIGDHILYSLAEEEALKIQNHLVSLFDFEVSLSKRDNEIKMELYDKLEGLGFNLSRKNDFLNSLDYKDKKVQKQVSENLQLMIKSKEIIKLDGDFLISKKRLEEAKNVLVDKIKKDGSIALGEYRDIICANRKVAICILDYFDKIGFTVRDGEVRVLKGVKV